MILFALLPVSAISSPISFYGDWGWRRWSQNSESSWSQTSSYNLGFSKELTDLSRVVGSFRYSEDRTKGRVTQQSTPSFSFILNNDLFSLNTSWSSTRRLNSEGPDYRSYSWDVDASSTWRRFPSLRLYYGRDRGYDNQKPHIVNTRGSHGGIDLNWSFSSLRVYSNLRETKSEDLAGRSTTKGHDRFLRAEFRKALLGGKLNLSLSQQLSYQKSIVEAKSGPGGWIYIPVSITSAYFGVDKTPDQGSLSPNPLLIDGDRSRSSGVDIGKTDYQNIAMEIDYRKVNFIYAYTLEDVDVSWLGMFVWGLYTSDDGYNWSFVSSPLVFSYNHILKRFEIELPSISVRYAKLVVSQVPDLGYVYITEIEAYCRLHGGEAKVTSRFVGLRSDLNIFLTPSKGWVVSYNFSRTRSIPDPGRINTDITRSGNITWNANKVFSPRFSVSEVRSKTEGEDEKVGRTFSLAVSSSPLATLDISGGFTRFMSYVGGSKETKNDTYSLYISAMVFPDLSSSLDLTRTESKNYESGDISKSTTGKIAVTCRVNPKLTVDSSYSYTKSVSDGTSIKKSFSFTSTWRASDHLLLRTTQDWNWDNAGKTKTVSYSVWVSPADKIQLNLQYSCSSENGMDSENYSGFFSWSISRFFSLKTNGTFGRSRGERNWSVGLELTAHF